MSSEHHEIVIIKRHGGGHEDEHHGGVWKIAFADFMTAMMAFFLVMWLISANDKTKAVIARYFNPVQLVDSTPQPKGLEDPKAGSPSVMPKAAAPAAEPKDTKAEAKPEDSKAEAKGSETKPAEAKVEGKGAEAKAESKAAEAKGDGKAAESKPAPSGKDAAKPAGAAPEALLAEKRDEAALFRDPYAVLAEIAGKNQSQPAREVAKAASQGAKGGAGAIGHKGGDAYRDPFEPVPVKGGPMADSTAQDAQANAQAQPEAPPPASAPGPGAAKNDHPDAPAPATPPSAGAAKTPELSPTQLAAQIETAVRETAAATPGGAPRLDIHRTGEGTVIDLTDGANFAMFGNASARPAPTMVALMEKIGRLLKNEKGLVTIRGFTDARPFRSDTYDNWRLSAARAHMAHYMLVRGGLDEQRVERIEGYADRQLKNPKDPNAAENRRIEILLRNPAP